ncbi:MAG: Fic family protein [Bifidobacteriaceae bacterium]|jgi:cell filamentation protein|nr:Fic family protein [Bifidobacteriaceae bacterium]
MTFVDPYFDPSVGDLRNLLGARSPAELNRLEAQAVFANELDLQDARIGRTNDLAELRRIHGHLFRGVYDWAGQLRTVDIRKNLPGAQFFLPVSFITRASAYVFGELGEADNLKNLSLAGFAERLAYFYDQLNYIHPFREGNGRAQRAFWSRVARDGGYTVDWNAVVGEENDKASGLAADHGDRSLLVAMFERIARQL